MKADTQTEAEIRAVLTRLADSYGKRDLDGLVASLDASGGPFDIELAGG
jgi:hypothetical protein